MVSWCDGEQSSLAPTPANFTLSPTAAPTVASDFTFTNTLIGCALVFCGTLCASFANVLIKYTHNKNEAAADGEKTSAACRPMWWFIFLLYVGNGLFDFTAYNYASISVLASMSALTIVVNILVARCLLGESASLLKVVGSFLIMAGSAVAVIYGPKPPASQEGAGIDKSVELCNDFFSEWFGWYNLIRVVLGIPCALVVYYEIIKQYNFFFPQYVISNTNDSVCDSPRLTPSDQMALLEPTNEESEPPRAPKPYSSLSMVCFSYITGAFGTNTNLFGKAAIELIFAATSEGVTRITSIFDYSIIICTPLAALVQLKFMAKMMNSYEATRIIPVFQCIFIFHLIAGGAAFFHELDPATITRNNLLLFGASIGLCCVGIGTIAWDNKYKKQRDMLRPFNAPS